MCIMMQSNSSKISGKKILCNEWKLKIFCDYKYRLSLLRAAHRIWFPHEERLWRCVKLSRVVYNTTFLSAKEERSGSVLPFSHYLIKQLLPTDVDQRARRSQQNTISLTSIKAATVSQVNFSFAWDFQGEIEKRRCGGAHYFRYCATRTSESNAIM
jgi:hypothetical protein